MNFIIGKLTRFPNTIYKRLKHFFLRNILGIKTFPSFLIIGAQKAGTSSLHYYLSQHPDLQSSIRKEVRFFTNLYYRGFNYYQKQFPVSTKKQIYFETTPEYLSYHKTAKRIHDYKSNIKLIILLRDPTKRAYSSWNMFKGIYKNEEVRNMLISKWTKESKDRGDQATRYEDTILKREYYPTFHECVYEELENFKNKKVSSLEFLRRGIYAPQIERYYNLFSKDQILILESNELKNKREEALTKVTQFLNIKNFDFNLLNLKEIGKRDYGDPLPEDLKLILDDFYKPYNKKLFKLIGQEYDWGK